MKNNILAQLQAASLGLYYISIHSSQPDYVGSNMIIPSKFAITWNAPSNGSMTQANTITFNIPANSTITHFGFWDQNNNFIAYIAVANPIKFGGSGTFTLSGLQVTI
jgi:hypothetical protein